MCISRAQMVIEGMDRYKHSPTISSDGVRVLVFNTTFNNISVISWRSRTTHIPSAPLPGVFSADVCMP